MRNEPKSKKGGMHFQVRTSRVQPEVSESEQGEAAERRTDAFASGGFEMVGVQK